MSKKVDSATRVGSKSWGFLSFHLQSIAASIVHSTSHSVPPQCYFLKHQILNPKPSKTLNPKPLNPKALPRDPKSKAPRPKLLGTKTLLKGFRV